MAYTDTIDCIYCPVCDGRLRLLYCYNHKDVIVLKCRDCGTKISVLKEELDV
jgi:uncharacterized protein YbaR (Trm112 family)